MECFRLLLEHLALIEHQFLSGIRDSRKPGSLWGMMRGVGGVRKSIHHSWLAKGLGLGLLYWGFKGVQEEIPSKSFMCVLSIKVPIRKKSVNLFNDPRISICYIYRFVFFLTIIWVMFVCDVCLVRKKYFRMKKYYLEDGFKKPKHWTLAYYTGMNKYMLWISCFFILYIYI